MEKLSTVLTATGKYEDKRGELASHMERYSWEVVIEKYDKEIEELVGY